MPSQGASKAAHLRSAFRAPRSELSRRGFLVLGGTGAAGIALAGCGSENDPRAEGDDVELIAAAAQAETAYGAAAKSLADQQGVSELIGKASQARLEELRSRADDAVPESGSRAESEPSAAAMTAIAAYRQGARLLSNTDLRTQASQFLGQVAGELAALRELEGDEPVPYSFVTGLDVEPLETSDDAPAGTAENTTTTSTSTTEEDGG